MASPRRLIGTFLVAVVALLATAQLASATHFAYGTLTWERLPFVSPSHARIRLTYEFGFRLDSEGMPGLVVGQPMPLAVQPSLWVRGTGFFDLGHIRAPLTVKSVSPGDDLIVGVGSMELSVPFSGLPLIVTTGSCCRFSDLREGNNDNYYQLATIIDLTKGSRSPVIAPLPRIYLMQNSPTAFQVPVLTPTGTQLTVTFSASAASLLTTPVPVGTCSGVPNCSYPEPNPYLSMTLTPGGLAEWTPRETGRYGVQFTATATSAAGHNNPSALLDTVVEVVADCPFTGPGCIRRPAFTTQPAPARVKVGDELILPFGASRFGGATTFAAVQIPAAAQLVETGADPDVATAELRWTPTAGDVGVHFACIQALNSVGQANFGVYCPLVEVWRDPLVTFESRLPLVQDIAVQTVGSGGFAVAPPPPATTQAGNYFVGWTLDPIASTQSALFPFATSAVTRDVTLHAIWTDQLRTVTFDSDDHELIPARFVPLGALAGEAPVPCCTEDRFEGWFLDDARTRPFLFDTDRIYDNTTLLAKWTFWVSVSTGGECRTATGWAPFTFICTPWPREGFTFEGWYLDIQLTRPYGGEPLASPYIRLFAKWTPIRVPYVFTGFLAPVENLPVLNVGQSGRTIPIKWRLARPDGTPVTALSSFVLLTESAIACDASPDSVLEEQLAESTGGGIRYEAADDLFIYNWKTNKGVTGCRLVTVTLDDDSRHFAKFKLQ